MTWPLVKPPQGNLGGEPLNDGEHRRNRKNREKQLQRNGIPASNQMMNMFQQMADAGLVNHQGIKKDDKGPLTEAYDRGFFTQPLGQATEQHLQERQSQNAELADWIRNVAQPDIQRQRVADLANPELSATNTTAVPLAGGGSYVTKDGQIVGMGGVTGEEMQQYSQLPTGVSQAFSQGFIGNGADPKAGLTQQLDMMDAADSRQQIMQDYINNVGIDPALEPYQQSLYDTIDMQQADNIAATVAPVTPMAALTGESQNPFRGRDDFAEDMSTQMLAGDQAKATANRLQPDGQIDPWSDSLADAAEARPPAGPDGPVENLLNILSGGGIDPMYHAGIMSLMQGAGNLMNNWEQDIQAYDQAQQNGTAPNAFGPIGVGLETAYGALKNWLNR